MKLKEIHRTSTFAWSPFPALPLIATGTVAGALDASFSNDSQLEIWSPDFSDRNEFDLGSDGYEGHVAKINTSSRFVVLVLCKEAAANPLVGLNLLDSIAWHGGMLARTEVKEFWLLEWRTEN